MSIDRRVLLSGLAGIAYPAAAGDFGPLQGSLFPVHDPCLIRANGLYHVFSTSQMRETPGLIHWRTSPDLMNWTYKGTVLPSYLDWLPNELPDARGAWAPDIVFADGEYRLYYSVSMFGKNTSRIALLTSPTLDSADPTYGWTDHGVVVRSETSNDFNAIDSHAFIDDDGRHWLSWGSFWTGIKLAELDPATGKLKKPKGLPRSLAGRDAPGAIEAPVIFKRGGFYYLFASFDACCRGINSTYHTVVGRAKAITGPYLDDKGKSMMNGGGRIVLHADLDPTGRWKGPGHCDVISDEGQDHIVYHAYDAQNGGRPTLRVDRLTWTADGWPVRA